jgi:hypothetical protein
MGMGMTTGMIMGRGARHNRGGWLCLLFCKYHVWVASVSQARKERKREEGPTAVLCKRPGIHVHGLGPAHVHT